jgi:hypothetical protein
MVRGMIGRGILGVIRHRCGFARAYFITFRLLDDFRNVFAADPKNWTISIIRDIVTTRETRSAQKGIARCRRLPARSAAGTQLI